MRGIPRSAYRLALNDTVKRKGFVIIFKFNAQFPSYLVIQSLRVQIYSKEFVLVGGESHTVRVVIILFNFFLLGSECHDGVFASRGNRREHA